MEIYSILKLGSAIIITLFAVWKGWKLYLDNDKDKQSIISEANIKIQEFSSRENILTTKQLYVLMTRTQNVESKIIKMEEEITHIRLEDRIQAEQLKSLNITLVDMRQSLHEFQSYITDYFQAKTIAYENKK